MPNWIIELNNLSLGGFAPACWNVSYPAYGNKNQAGAMVNCDLTDPTFLTQGPGLANLTNGTQAAAVTTLIKGMLDMAVTSNLTYGIGGNKLYSLNATTVTNNGTFPHTIDKAAVTGEDGEDVCYFQGALYYAYNHSGSAGDIGKYDLASTFDDDWGSTVPTGKAALTNNPHQMIAAGNDFMYWADGAKIGSYDGTTFTSTDLDLPNNSVVSSIAWTSNRLWVAANQPNLSGANKNIASIYIWDGNAPSWEDEIRIMGRIGALYVKNGVLFVFYEDISDSGGYKLGYVNGTQISELASFTGGLPLYYQITDYKNFLIWNSNGLIRAYGNGAKELPMRLFQLADGGYSTVGCVKCPFGTPLIASTQSSDYRLAKFSGYDTACSWYSLLFDITGNERKSIINKMKLNFEVLASGARMDYALKDNKATSLNTGTVSYSGDGAITAKDFYPQCEAENFRIELDWSNGSAANAVKVKNIKIYGHTLE